MQIHVVTPGQSVYGIAQAYNTSPDQIISANELRAPNQLVVGQALVIPITGSYYFVQPGDTLTTISQKVGIPVSELAGINKISVDAPLNVGTRLYIPPRTNTDATFVGYIVPRGSTVSTSLENSARQAVPYLSYLAPFSFEIQRDGALKEPPLGNLPTIGSQQSTTPMMVITNLENDAFSTELAQIVLNDMGVQSTLIDNIVVLARKYGFTNVHFDMERLRPEDSNAFVNFLSRVHDTLAGQGISTSVALAPKTSEQQVTPWTAGHNYEAVGAVVDFVVIMTYEWGYSGGPAQAVSPIGPVRDVLTYATSVIPPNKVIMGQNLYGYDWTLPFRPGSIARAISPQQAIDIARENNAVIQYDTRAQAPFFRYRDASGRAHEVWFEDARSIQAKFNLLKELNLRGMAFWKLGMSFPQVWQLIQENFNVNKV
ncbi:glycoside hydrolase family 18 protein [Bacillus sp. AGMB 02131]|uniref:Glycoside hydrolase family 18 protein n=1 Tax=Peribacillus faecalis TaxID=2772559 RepID=A0A927CT85_9BACI|nr:glycoside hydrolase family 18 protein [Peribacillus faecalis]MBD3107113.1 glycoside hydrolase family 18 protein [Peribacillus faecalis]